MVPQRGKERLSHCRHPGSFSSQCCSNELPREKSHCGYGKCAWLAKVCTNHKKAPDFVGNETMHRRRIESCPCQHPIRCPALPSVSQTPKTDVSIQIWSQRMNTSPHCLSRERCGCRWGVPFPVPPMSFPPIRHGNPRRHHRGHVDGPPFREMWEETIWIVPASVDSDVPRFPMECLRAIGDRCSPQDTPPRHWMPRPVSIGTHWEVAESSAVANYGHSPVGGALHNQAGAE
mmetsp:Transcript_7328/g.16652  ORF Transcript_7328/g.16652 Transcript_7328/m.16652 type:complete len:232 (+) Transcript_7328:971-1666(+)